MKLRSPSAIVLGAALVCVAPLFVACGAPSNRALHSVEITRAQPEPTAWITFTAPSGLRERADIADRFGAARLYEVAGGRVVLAFIALADAKGATDLKQFSTAQDALFLELVGPREVSPLQLGETARTFTEAGLKHVARAYLNSDGREALCDAAAVRFATPGGFWTLSWNASIGDVAAATERVSELVRALRIERR